MGLSRNMLALAIALAVSVHAMPCPVVPERSYLRLHYGDPADANWLTTDFDDSEWALGNFPLGSCPSCPELDKYKPFFYYPGDSIVATRVEVELTKQPVEAVMKIRAGDKAWIYVNGVKITDVHNPPNCDPATEGYPLVDVNIDPNLLTVGKNVLAVKGMATTDTAFLQYGLEVVTADQVCDGLTTVSCGLKEGKDTKVLYVTEAIPRPEDWRELDIDESNFVDGTFPFANSIVCEELSCITPASDFPIGSTIVTRNKVLLTKVPTDAKIRVITDDSSWVYLNGVHLGDVHWANCAASSSGKAFQVPDGVLVEGENILAITAVDKGTQSILDVDIWFTDDECVAEAVVTPPPKPTIQCDAMADGAIVKVLYGEAPDGTWIQPTFDDSSWLPGNFPLGSCPTCAELEKYRPFFYYPGNSVVTTRTTVFLNKAPKSAILKIRAGDKAWIYINGVKIRDVHNGPCDPAQDGYPLVEVPIQEGLFTEGENVIAIKGMATTDEAFLHYDLDIVTEDETCDGQTDNSCPVLSDSKDTKVLYVTEEVPLPEDYKNVDADESNYLDVQFPLGSEGQICPGKVCSAIGGDFPISSILVTRNKFTLEKVPKSAYIRVNTDDSAWVFLNGKHLGDIHSKGSCEVNGAGRLFTVNAADLVEGVNILAIKAQDKGDASYLDVVFYVSDDGECDEILGDVPAPTPGPCDNQLSDKRCARLAELGRCSRKRIFDRCPTTCNPECGAEVPPPGEEIDNPPPAGECTNKYSNSRCKREQEAGKCTKAFILRNCQLACNPDCGAEEPETPEVPAPEDCKNTFADARCAKYKKDGKCDKAFVNRSCQKTCNPACGADEPQEPDAPEKPCNGQCRRKEACMEKNGTFFCVDCGIFARKSDDGKETCCSVNEAGDQCMSNPTLERECKRQQDIYLHLVDPEPIGFMGKTGNFCGSFREYENVGAAFPVKPW